MMTSDPGQVRAQFESAARGFLATVSELGRDDWDRPGLGVWNMRDLVGHTSRALLTVEAYLAAAPDPDAPVRADAVDYFCAGAAVLADPTAVAKRGREAGIALGEDPLTVLRDLVERVAALVADSPDDAPIGLPVGRMSLISYLPTRTFELAVHSLDIGKAAGIPVAAELAESIAASLYVAAGLAIASGQTPEALLALTGRQGLPASYTVLVPATGPT